MMHPKYDSSYISCQASRVPAGAPSELCYPMVRLAAQFRDFIRRRKWQIVSILSCASKA
jgi:hypothetical protein